MKKGYFICGKEALSDILFHTIDNDWKRKIKIDNISVEPDTLDSEYFYLRIEISGDDLPDDCDENPERLRFRIIKETKRITTVLEADEPPDCDTFEDAEFVTKYKVEISKVPPEFR